jgi:hypothetical protein
MPEPRNRGRELRALWATLAVVCLLAAGVAYGATRYLQSELEADATQDARKLTNGVLEPLLSDKDAAGPVRGARYGELLASMRERVLAGPITGLRLWAQDGTIVFSDDRQAVGERDAKVRVELHATIAGSSTSVVEDGEFRTTTSMRVGDPPTIVAAELIRSHEAIVEESREQWYPWVGRSLTAAAALGGLWVVTLIAFGALGLAQARRAARGEAVEAAESAAPSARADRPARPGRPAGQAPGDENLPAYMRPGFREEIEARRRMELEGLAADT